MIVTRKKPTQELLDMIGGAKRVALIGCGSCATVCGTGGKREVAALTVALRSLGKEVVAAEVVDYGCMSGMVRAAVRKIAAAKPDCVVGMSCGDGVQCAAKVLDCPIYPANNTLFLGESVRLGEFHEACHLCGDCMLGQTGGICPIARCAKSLVNGPCGGARNGRCEVNPENPCAWIEIYNRLVALGQEEKLLSPRRDKDYDAVAYPRTVNIREEKP